MVADPPIEEPIEQLFISGNHLASVLLSRDILPGEYAYANQVGKRHGIEAMDIWIAWKAIMDFSKADAQARVPDSEGLIEKLEDFRDNAHGKYYHVPTVERCIEIVRQHEAGPTVMGGTAPQSADASADGSEVRGSAARAMDSPPASDTASEIPDNVGDLDPQAILIGISEAIKRAGYNPATSMALAIIAYDVSRPYLRTFEPVTVSLEKCAEVALAKDNELLGTDWVSKMDWHRKVLKAVLPQQE